MCESGTNETYKYLTAILKKVFINRFSELVKNTTILSIGQLKWYLLMLNIIHFINFDVEFNTRDLNIIWWSCKGIKIGKYSKGRLSAKLNRRIICY